MKKIKQLSLILFISAGLFSCEAEKTDDQLSNEFLPGEQIFRYELDGQTRVTNDVTVSSSGSLVTIHAVFNDAISEFKTQTFTISLNKLAVGSYVSSVGNINSDDIYGFASASYKHHNVNWSYSTQNVKVNADNVTIQTGSLDILSINDKAKYFEGKFEFDLYAPLTVNENNSIAPVKVRNGYFQYIKYN